MEERWPGQALGALCSFWEAYINTGWDGEERGVAMAAQGKKQPPPGQLSLSGKKEQGLLSLLPLLSPGLQLLVGLERLRYLGGGGQEKERERMRLHKFGIPPPLLNWGEGEWGRSSLPKRFSMPQEGALAH